jgi:hypothetical protein
MLGTVVIQFAMMLALQTCASLPPPRHLPPSLPSQRRAVTVKAGLAPGRIKGVGSPRPSRRLQFSRNKQVKYLKYLKVPKQDGSARCSAKHTAVTSQSLRSAGTGKQLGYQVLNCALPVCISPDRRRTSFQRFQLHPAMVPLSQIHYRGIGKRSLSGPITQQQLAPPFPTWNHTIMSSALDRNC